MDSQEEGQQSNSLIDIQLDSARDGAVMIHEKSAQPPPAPEEGHKPRVKLPANPSSDRDRANPCPWTEDEKRAVARTFGAAWNGLWTITIVWGILALAVGAMGLIFVAVYEHKRSSFEVQIVNVVGRGENQTIGAYEPRVCYAHQCAQVSWGPSQPAPLCYVDRYERFIDGDPSRRKSALYAGQAFDIHKPGSFEIDGQPMCSTWRTTIPRSWHVIGKYSAIFGILGFLAGNALLGSMVELNAVYITEEIHKRLFM